MNFELLLQENRNQVLIFQFTLFKQCQSIIANQR
jgi:hypothetical protein